MTTNKRFKKEFKDVLVSMTVRGDMPSDMTTLDIDSVFAEVERNLSIYRTKADNAIKWIESLKTTREKQSKFRLGDSKSGFCCLGLGCKILGVSYEPFHTTSNTLKEVIGLHDTSGRAKNLYLETKPERYVPVKIKGKVFEVTSLVRANDIFDLSFRRIATMLIKNPYHFFKEEVAELVEEHFKK
jgi:cytochrome b involved in lipid metabolism